MRRRQRTALVVATVALLAIAAAVAVWWFRTPLLELIPTPPIVVTEKDQGRVITMIPGERLEVRLPANANSGNLWRVGIPLSYLPQTGGPQFVETGVAGSGAGYQAIQFIATGKGSGPLFLDIMPENDQNSLNPARSFTIVVTVR